MEAAYMGMGTEVDKVSAWMLLGIRYSRLS